MKCLNFFQIIVFEDAVGAVKLMNDHSELVSGPLRMKLIT